MTIRDALDGEAPALEALQRRASLVYEDSRQHLLDHPDAIQVTPELIGGGRGRVAVGGGGRVLGFAAILPIVDGRCELDGLFVEPDAWGHGVGRALVDDAARQAGERGAGQLDVYANPNAVGFYRKVGFTGTELAPMRWGSAVRMSRLLERSRALGDLAAGGTPPVTSRPGSSPRGLAG